MKYPLKILLIIGVFVAVLLFAARVRLGNSEIIYAEPIDTSDVLLLAQATVQSDATSVPDSGKMPPSKPIRIDVPASPNTPLVPIATRVPVKKEKSAISESKIKKKSSPKISAHDWQADNRIQVVDPTDPRLSRIVPPEIFYKEFEIPHIKHKNKDNSEKFIPQPVEPDSSQVVEIDGKLYYRYYMTPEKLTKKFNIQYMDLSDYKGYYLVPVLPDVSTIADSILQDSLVDSVEVVDYRAVKIYITWDNLIAKNGGRAPEMRKKENYPGFVYFELPKPMSDIEKQERIAEHEFVASQIETEIYGEFDPSTEILEKRTPNARHFRNPDGSITAIIGASRCSDIYPEHDIPHGEKSSTGLPERGRGLERTLETMDLWEDYLPDYLNPYYYGGVSNDYFWSSYKWGGTTYNEDDCGYGGCDYWYCAVGRDYDWADEYYRIQILWDISSIPDGSDVTNSEIKFYVMGWQYSDFDNDYIWIDVYECNTAGGTPEEVYNECGDDTRYISSEYLEYTGTGHYDGYHDLGPSADADIEAHLSSDWFAVGLKDYRTGTDEGVVLNGDYTWLKITYNPPCTSPSNESCSGAIYISPSSTPYSYSGQLGCTDDCSGQGYFDVFFSFTPRVTGSYTIDMCGSNGDTYLRIFTGSCCGTFFASDDDGCGGYDPQWTGTLTGGTTYYFECGSYSSTGMGNSSYNFNLTRNCSSPGNETCAGATTITYAQISAGYSDSGNLGCSDDCAGRPYYDVFYRYDCTVSGSYTFDMGNSDGDTYMKIYSGSCCGTLVASDDDSYGGSDPEITVTLSAGTTYWIECGSYYSTDMGNAAYNFHAVKNNSPPHTPVRVANVSGSLFNNARTNDSTPRLGFRATDDDGDNLQYEVQIDDNYDFSSPVGTWTSGWFASGANAYLDVGSALSDGTYYWRVRAYDGAAHSGWSSGYWSFTVQSTMCEPDWFQTLAPQFNEGSLSGSAAIDWSNNWVYLTGTLLRAIPSGDLDITDEPSDALSVSPRMAPSESVRIAYPPGYSPTANVGMPFVSSISGETSREVPAHILDYERRNREGIRTKMAIELSKPGAKTTFSYQEGWFPERERYETEWKQLSSAERLEKIAQMKQDWQKTKPKVPKDKRPMVWVERGKTIHRRDKVAELDSLMEKLSASPDDARTYALAFHLLGEFKGMVSDIERHAAEPPKETVTIQAERYPSDSVFTTEDIFGPGATIEEIPAGPPFTKTVRVRSHRVARTMAPFESEEALAGTGWLTNINTDNSSEDDNTPTLATNANGDIYAALCRHNSTSGYNEVWIYKSTDNGLTWTAEWRLYNSSYNIQDPVVAIDIGYDSGSGPGRLFVAMDFLYSGSDYDIYVWWWDIETSPPNYGQVGVDTDGDYDSCPCITSEYQYGNYNYQYIVWHEVEGILSSSGDDMSIHLMRSTDHGVTWTDHTSFGEGWTDWSVRAQPWITNSQGYVYASYSHGDNWDDRYYVIVARSTDYGNSWQEITAFHDPGDDNPVYATSIASTHGGNAVAVAFQSQWSSTDDDVRIAYSTDQGNNWDWTFVAASSDDDERTPSIGADGMGSTSNSINGYLHVVYYRYTSGTTSDGYVHYKRALYSSPGSWDSGPVNIQVSDGNYFVEDNWAQAGITTRQGDDGNWYPCVNWTDARNPSTDIYYSTWGAQYTINTNPGAVGLQIQVDGVGYTNSKTFQWPAGMHHQLYAPSPQTIGTNEYYWTSWSDGGAQTHTITSQYGSSSYTITANYQLGKGTITSPAIYYNSYPGSPTGWDKVEWSSTGDVTVTVEYCAGGTWNSTGISGSSSPLDISGLSPATYDSLRLVAELKVGAIDPYLYDWTVKWQGGCSEPTITDIGGYSDPDAGNIGFTLSFNQGDCGGGGTADYVDFSIYYGGSWHYLGRDNSSPWGITWTSASDVNCDNNVMIGAYAWDGCKLSDFYQEGPFTVDNTTPTASVTYPHGWISTTSFTVTKSGSDGCTSVSNGDLEYRSRPYGGSWGSWTEYGSDWGDMPGDITFTGSNCYEYQFRYRTQDQAGNTSGYNEPPNITSIDNQNPSVNTPTDGGDCTNSNSITFTVTGSDACSGVSDYYLQIDDATDFSTPVWEGWIGSSGTYTWSGASNGNTYYARAYAKDAAGNTSGWSGISDGISVNTAPLGTWTGAYNTDWDNPRNWGQCTVPDATIDVTIPQGCNNYPVIDETDAVCNSITIDELGTLSFSSTTPGRLQVYGSFTNNGTFNEGIGTVTFAGSSGDYTIGGASPITFYILEVTKTGGSLTLGRNITVTNYTDVDASGNVGINPGSYEIVVP